MDLVAQLVGTLCDGILQSCAETRASPPLLLIAPAPLPARDLTRLARARAETSLVRDLCGRCCPCAAPYCSQEAGWDSLGEPGDEDDDEAAVGEGEADGTGAAGSSAAERAQEQQGLARDARAGYGAVRSSRRLGRGWERRAEVGGRPPLPPVRPGPAFPALSRSPTSSPTNAAPRCRLGATDPNQLGSDLSLSLSLPLALDEPDDV